MNVSVASWHELVAWMSRALLLTLDFSAELIANLQIESPGVLCTTSSRYGGSLGLDGFTQNLGQA